MTDQEMMLAKRALVRVVAKAICKSRTCEGINCCQWPANGGRPNDLGHARNTKPRNCPVDAGGYDDAALDAIVAYQAAVGVEAGEQGNSRHRELEQSPSPNPRGDALREAREIVDFNPLHDGDFDDEWGDKAERVARAYLALSSGRGGEAVIEECARAAEDIGFGPWFNAEGADTAQFQRDIAAAIRALSPQGTGKEEKILVHTRPDRDAGQAGDRRKETR